VYSRSSWCCAAKQPVSGACNLKWLLLHLQVWGNLGAFLERLDDEWNGSLKVRDWLT